MECQPDARRKERLHAALWLVMVLCVLGGISMTRFRSPSLMGVLGAGFWASLVAYLVSSSGARKDLWWFLPLVPLYLLIHLNFAFVWNGRIVEPQLMGTDGQRFFRMARTWAVEERHVGWSFFTFLYHPAQAVGRSWGALQAGRFVLHLQTAVIGALAAWMVFMLGGQAGPRIPRLLSAYFFALSLAVWLHASVIDTYIVSVFLFLVFLREAHGYFSGERDQPLILGLVAGVLLGISLENVHAPLLGVALFPLLRRPHQRPWRHLLVYAGTVACTFGAFTGMALLTSAGPKSVALSKHVLHYARLPELLSLRAFTRVLFNETTASVLAQQAAPAQRYYYAAYLGIDGLTGLYVALLLVLLAFALQGLQRSDLRGSPLLWMLLGTLVVRHGFMTFFNPNENILFAAPTIAVLAILLGRGASDLHGRRLVWYGATLFSVDVLLLICNGSYLHRALTTLHAQFQ